MSIFQEERYSALLSSKEKRCRKSHGVRVEPVWGLLVIISCISVHRWPAQSYHLSFRTKKSKNWRKSATSWLPSWERLTEFPPFAQWICIWLLLSWPQYLALPRNCCPFAEKKTLKKHMPTAACPALLPAHSLEEPWSGAPTPQKSLVSAQRRLWSSRQAAELGLWFLCMNSFFFFFTAVYFPY